MSIASLHARRAIVAAFVSAALASPAAHGKKKLEPAPPSGFLGDYGLLEAHPGDPTVKVFMESPDALAGYERFIIDDVEVHLVPDSPGHELSEDELAELRLGLAQSFRDALTAALYESVTEPGPRTLRVRLAITDLQPVGKGSRAGNVAAGAAAGVALPGIGFLLPRFSVGRTAIEMELVDSQSGERIGAAMATTEGKRSFAGLKAYKRWGDVKHAFDEWATQFRSAVDAAHGRLKGRPGQRRRK